MEIITILIGVAVFIISALMIYCISAFSMREKTFEEVMEEQRRRQEEEKEKAKAEKKAERETQKKKYKKGKQEKVKEKSAQVTEPELKADHKMVNLEIEPEIIEPTESLGLGSGVRQRGKKEKAAKSILHNKTEVTPVAEKTVEVHHKPIVPKDELELKKAHEKHDKVVVEKVEKVKATHTESHAKETKSKHSSESKENLPPKKTEKVEEHKSKKRVEEDVRPTKTKTSTSSDDGPLNGSRLISSVKSAKLSDNEVQTLIDILLNRQGLTPTGPSASESWNKKSQKGDPVYLLKKQLEEKEKALQEEQNIAMTANARLKELKNELVTEKNKFATMEKGYREKVGMKQAEMDALQQRMQHTHENHMHEVSTLQAHVRQLEQGGGGGDRATAQKLTEEKKVLQETLTLKAKETVSLNEKVKLLEKEISNSVSKAQASEAGKKGLESKINMYEEKIRKLEAAQKDVDSMVNKRVEDVSSELRNTEAKNAKLQNEITKLNTNLQDSTGALSTAESELSKLRTKLQELETHLSKAESGKESEVRLQESERKRSDLEGNVKNLEKQLADLSQRLGGSETEVQRLQQENRTLSEENKMVTERLQAAPASNGDIHDNGPSVSLADHEKVMSEKSKEVSDLTASLEQQKKAVTNIQSQLDTKAAEVADLQQQLTTQKAKNNELREKNWKAMEALEKSEKSSAEKVDKALKSARDVSSAGAAEVETYDKAVFQRLFPDVSVSDKLPHKEWIVAFEKQAVKKLPNNANDDRLKDLDTENKKLTKQLSEYEHQFTELNSRLEKIKRLEEENSQLKSSQSSATTVNTDKISQLESDNARLKSEVDNYRSIVSETENKLRQLEKSIDEEAKKWQEKLKQAQSGSQDASSANRISELETLVSQQERQMQEYRQVLSHTESSLKEVEEKVAGEEEAWQGRLSSAQSELAQAKDELAKLRSELQNSPGSQEMANKVERLETELRQAEERIIVITKEKETVITQISETQKQSSSVDTQSLEKQLVELRTQLETERKKNKEMSLNVVKLNGIIKTGQDALTQEQGLVKKLQESLDSKSVSSGLSEMEEMEQAGTSNDNGTSV